MEEIEALEKYEVTIKGTNGVGFQNILIQQSEVEKLVASLKGKHHKELEEKDRRHKDELEKKDSKIGDLENEKKNLARELDELKKARSEHEEDKKTFENEKKKLEAALKDIQEEIKALEQKNAKLQDEKVQIQQKTDDEIEDIKAEKSKLEEDLDKSKADLNQLEQDCKLELYKMYKEFSPDSDQYGIKSSDLYNFIVTSGQVIVLTNILRSIKVNVGNAKEITKDKEFFEKLFENIKGYYGLERLCTQVGDEYDDKKHLKIDGDTIGRVSEVVVDGFKAGEKIYQSIVKVQK
ncbi:hypothetical protein [Helicobacter pullorum]|uniref:hypothetical protein n=1 Tax=Helicobacter pullorum TaxID=35818 RepID=UPI0006CD7490|nr:hypothetical protein [Helicobacter pullorum]KPH52242.1 hypothetical protein HPU229254_03065 [Helicobacter pullorum]